MKYTSGNLFLVGLMGAGKSTVGRQLAARLNKRFIDTDHEIESRTGVKISVIFEIEGEAGFRKRESEAIDTLTSASGIVLATGGGAVLAAGNRAALKSRGFTIYLAANLNDLWMRTRHDKSRPLLQTENPRRRLEELLEERDPLYREVADMVVETGRPSVQRLTALILANLASRPECAGLLTSAVTDTRIPDTAE